MSKKIIIIAGANGAGKTTFAKEFLPNEAACPTFVNADLDCGRSLTFFAGVSINPCRQINADNDRCTRYRRKKLCA